MVLFCHGFSQPIDNYTGTLEALAEQAGALVIGPKTSFFNTLGIIAGSGSNLLGEFTARPPTKLQVLC